MTRRLSVKGSLAPFSRRLLVSDASFYCRDFENLLGEQSKKHGIKSERWAPRVLIVVVVDVLRDNLAISIFFSSFSR
jgi:hypothetical protein